MFSKACEYGIKASAFIATESLNGRRTSLSEIAKKIDSPVAFTAKVLQQLTKSEILLSVKGPSGGFEFDNKKIGKIMLSQIVTAIDGNDVYLSCALGFKNCSSKKPCPLHFHIKQIRDDLQIMLENTSLADLSKDIEKGKSFLKQ